MSDSVNPDLEVSLAHPKGSKSKKLVWLLVALTIMALGIAVYVLAKKTKPDVEEVPLQSSKAGVCISEGCVREAFMMLRNMRKDVDPCEDFYEYSCGNFLKNQLIPKDKSQLNAFVQLEKLRDEKLRSVFQEKISQEDSSIVKMVKNMFTSCMDEESIEELGLDPVTAMISELGGWPVIAGDAWREQDFSLEKMIFENRKKGLSISTLFAMNVAPDMRNASAFIISFDQPHLSLSTEYLVKGLQDPAVEAQLAFSIDAAVLFGANRAKAQLQMRDVLDFEISLAQASQPKSERKNLTKLYHPLKLSELDKESPLLSWKDFINEILPNKIKVDENETIIVYDFNYIKNMTMLINQTPKRTLANYMIWRSISQIVKFLSHSVRNLKLPLIKALYGKSSYAERWAECVNININYLSLATSSIYVRRFFDSYAKEQMNELVHFLRSQFEQTLLTLDWMDERTRQEAIMKAKAMHQNIAYTPQLLDEDILGKHYKDLTITNESYLSNALRINKFTTDYDFGLLRENVKEFAWLEFGKRSVLINAFYRWSTNTIVFPAGILQGVFFESDRPKYMNYAGIGMVIGHEVVHGFDDRGRQLDYNGTLRNWWLSETEKRFKEKAQCFVEQYGSYSQDGLKLNGNVTLGENMADNGGHVIAYKAYQEWAKENPAEETLPGLHHLNPNQLFWLASSQKHCVKYTSEELKRIILTYYHAPLNHRLVGTLSNMEEFAKDWNCPLGSRMNPMKKCKVW